VGTTDWASDVQGNVYPGFRKDHQAFVVISFADRAAGQRWLGELRADIAACDEVEAFNQVFKLLRRRRGDEARALRGVSATWVNVALSASGLQRLLGAEEMARLPVTFRNNRIPWTEARSDASEQHALLLIASDRAADLDTELARQREVLWGNGARELGCYRGSALGGTAREHFGFEDAASAEPLLSGPDANQAGAFILGAGGAPLNGPAWTRHGSYLAFLQLEQHVLAFREVVRREAERLGARPGDVAASILGRPVGADAAAAPPPFSHIGRGSPRWLLGAEAARRRILRRGIPYGLPPAEGQSADGGRGLLFLAYQADPAGQFEYIWQNWLNGPDFPARGAGSDGLVGQTGLSADGGGYRGGTLAGAAPSRTVAVPAPGRQRGLVGLRLPRFVTPRYGGYFFAPSIGALRQLGRDRDPRPPGR
jgi:Dyp-type peroxidase family